MLQYIACFHPFRFVQVLVFIQFHQMHVKTVQTSKRLPLPHLDCNAYRHPYDKSYM